MLEYQNNYYTLSARRIPYQKDKTADERYFVLTRFAIANEIEQAGEYSDAVLPIELAVGLPPATMVYRTRRLRGISSVTA